MSLLDLVSEGIRASAIQALAALSDAEVKTLFVTGINKIADRSKLNPRQKQRLLGLLQEALVQITSGAQEPMAEPVEGKARCPHCKELHDVRMGMANLYVLCPVNNLKYWVRRAP